MGSFLTGFEVLKRVYSHLQREYGVGTLSLPERSMVIAGGADHVGEAPWKLWYEDFGIVQVPLDKKRARIWILGLGEGTGKKNGYAGDLVGVSVNSAAITGEHLAPYLSRFANLEQSLVQALSDGPLAFQSRLSSRVAREAKEILPRYLVRSTGYSGQERAREFSSVDIKYQLKVTGDGKEVGQPPDEEIGDDKGFSETGSAPQKRRTGEKRNIITELSDIILGVLKIP